MTIADDKKLLKLRIQDARRNVGARIRELRHDQDWSQEVFARMCGINATRLGRIERGKADVTIELLASIAHKLGTTAEQILDTFTPGTAATQPQS
jgi:transcriptional regulator with XRE-family HTH domain